jgi:myo-inositol-1(or 4)-monophosphatase
MSHWFSWICRYCWPRAPIFVFGRVRSVPSRSAGSAVDGPERLRNYDARVRPELAAAHAAVDEAVKILRDGRARPHKRIGKAAKDFFTEVDLASESAMQGSLAESTPEIGFYGEEGGGAALESGRVWVADPLDGTINYATGSPLCGVMLGLLEDGVPTLGVIDLPFLGVRVDSGAVADVDALEEGIIGMGDAFHRGGVRMEAYLELTVTMHRRALRFRCVGAASVLWAWLVDGQIQGMFLAHNNPYDVVAGHAIARAAGAICTDYAGAPLTLESEGAMAAVPGIQPELVSLAADLAAAARDS